MGKASGKFNITEAPVREAQDKGDVRGPIAPGTHKGQEILQPTKSPKLEMPKGASSMESKELKLPAIDAKGIGTVETFDQKRDRALEKGSKK
jgi:hypothetical protein